MQLSKAEQERYNRHLILDGFGERAQLKIKQARVLVVGAGGLGCPALLYLTAAGVGTIGIADDDVVSLSNLQRQVLYNTADIGSYKTLAAEKHLSALNTEVTIQSICKRVDASNVLSLIEDYDLVIDGTDNFNTRYLLSDACVIKKKPLVYGAIYKYEGQVSVFNVDDGPTYRCLFPLPPALPDIQTCNETGVLGVLPGIVGTWQAAEAIKLITGKGETLKGVVMSFDLLRNTMNYFKFKTVEENKKLEHLTDAYFNCSTTTREIDTATLKTWLAEKDIQLIDVRELHEYDQFNIGGKHLPLSQLKERASEIDSGKITVVHCESGVRSKKAVDLILSIYPSIDVLHLKDGLRYFK